MLSFHLNITRPLRMRKPSQPTVQLAHTKAEAQEWFSGVWTGLFMGAIIGAGLATVFLQAVK